MNAEQVKILINLEIAQRNITDRCQLCGAEGTASGCVRGNWWERCDACLEAEGVVDAEDDAEHADDEMETDSEDEWCECELCEADLTNATSVPITTRGGRQINVCIDCASNQ